MYTLYKDGKDVSSTDSSSSGSIHSFPVDHPFRLYLSKVHLETLQDSPLGRCEALIADNYEVFVNCIYWHTKKGKRISHMTTGPEMRAAYYEYIKEKLPPPNPNVVTMDQMKWHEHQGDSDNEEVFLKAHCHKKWDGINSAGQEVEESESVAETTSDSDDTKYKYQYKYKYQFKYRYKVKPQGDDKALKEGKYKYDAKYLADGTRAPKPEKAPKKAKEEKLKKIPAPPPLLGLRKRNTAGPWHSRKELEALFPFEDYTAKYKNITVVAKGSFGCVHLGEVVGNPSEKVAIKMTKLDSDPERIHNIAIEIALMEACIHPNVLKHKQSFYWNKAIWSVLEFCNGGALTSLRKVRLGEPQLRYIMRQLLQGLQFIHSQNIAHRDLKCANIMLRLHCTQEGDKVKILTPEFKIGDFGLSCIVKGPTSQFSMVGSRYWMSPEMIQRIGYGLKTDIYSLGCVMFELMTGSAPYRKMGGLYSLFFHATQGCPQLPPSERTFYSNRCQSFWQSLVRIDPNKRLDAATLLKSAWLNKSEEPDNCLEKHLNTAFRCHAFGDPTLLRKTRY